MLYLISFAICVAVVAFVAAPLFNERRAWVQMPAPARRAMLIDERDALLRDLKDLDFDREMGKLDEVDYAEMRADSAQKASAVLEALESGVASPNGRGRVQRDIEAEVLIARARLRLQKAPGGWKCVCGRQMSDSDKFCASCGAVRSQSA